MAVQHTSYSIYINIMIDSLFVYFNIWFGMGHHCCLGSCSVSANSEVKSAGVVSPPVRFGQGGKSTKG